MGICLRELDQPLTHFRKKAEMMTKSASRTLRIWIAVLSLVLMLLTAHSSRVVAQQWNTNSNGTDISNANAGNVGIGTGTNSPGSKLDIFSSGTARILLGDGCSQSGIYGGRRPRISPFHRRPHVPT